MLLRLRSVTIGRSRVGLDALVIVQLTHTPARPCQSPDAQVPAVTQRQVGYREILEHHKCDLTCQVKRDWTRNTSDPPQPRSVTYIIVRHHDQTHPPVYSVVIVCQHLITRQVETRSASSFYKWPDSAPPRQVTMWPASGHCLTVKKHLLHFTNFSTLAQMCQPPSVPAYARVLAYFHKYFQGC
jgi:hypothetical protein